MFCVGLPPISAWQLNVESMQQAGQMDFALFIRKKKQSSSSFEAFWGIGLNQNMAALVEKLGIGKNFFPCCSTQKKTQ
jgi:hypothetical protein